ncbi:MAG TPA: sodium:solute symporter [Gemmatimonadales bacterium]|nr:sodium:solute symporter [Gemmatimonadales bacterium]
MTSLDLVVVGAYFAVTLGIGVWSSRRQATAGDYFLGARNLPAWAVLLSIVSTETSALTVISIPGIGARGDLTFLQLAIGYVVGRIGVAVWLLPGYFTGEQETAYARLESRFGIGTRRLLSVVFLVTRFLADGVRIFAGAIPLALISGWSIPGAIVVMGLVTLVYTFFGGLKAVVWADVLQLAVYIAGGVAALVIGLELAGGPRVALAAAAAAGKLRLIDPTPSPTAPYTLIGGVIGGAMLSAASHGTDHLIVQRLLATRSLGAARVALIGSGLVVFLQFLLFLAVGIAVWSAGLAPRDIPADEIFTRFVLQYLPVGLVGLVIAGILAAAMSSSISALASSVTHDLYAGWTGRTDPTHLFRVGRAFSAGWGIGLILMALTFHYAAANKDTPLVVLALSIASVTYGVLLGGYLLAGIKGPRGSDVIAAAAVTMPCMLIVMFARALSSRESLAWLAPLGRLAWPWYVPLGTLLMVAIGILSSRIRRTQAAPA